MPSHYGTQQPRQHHGHHFHRMFPNNPALVRAKLLDPKHIRLQPHELDKIDRHMGGGAHTAMHHPLAAAHKHANMDKIQKRKPAHEMEHTRFGHHAHPAARYLRPYPPVA